MEERACIFGGLRLPVQMVELVEKVLLALQGSNGRSEWTIMALRDNFTLAAPITVWTAAGSKTGQVAVQRDLRTSSLTELRKLSMQSSRHAVCACVCASVIKVKLLISPAHQKSNFSTQN